MRAVFAAWNQHADRSRRVLESGFDNDVGGTSIPPAEDQKHAVRRSRLRNIPDYDATSDPHLVRFWRDQRRLERLRPGTAGAVRAPTQPREPFGMPTSADHVLALKRIFFRFATQVHCIACRSDQCTVHAAGLKRERIPLMDTLNTDMHGVIRFGIGVSNHHRKLNHVPPLSSSPTQEHLYEWLVLLKCERTVDWPSFLLMCTADLVADYARLVQLHNAHAAFLTKHGVHSEADYHVLLAYLAEGAGLAFLRPEDAEVECDRNGVPTTASFFQSGDFFRTRHVCSFADTVFSLCPHRVQFYLSKANARGLRLTMNFCGHAPAVAELPKTDGARAPRRPVSAARHEQLTKPPPSKNPRVAYLTKQASRQRFHCRVWL